MMAEEKDTKIRDLEDFAGIASDWFWETDAEHRFTYFSGRMEEVTKIPKAEILGRRRDIVASDRADLAKWDEHIADLNACRPFKDFEYSINRRTDGSVLWMRVAGQPLFADDGTFIGYRGTGHDITHEKEAMQRLVETNTQLAERNRELDETRNALERAAYVDALTGLRNRRSFERDLKLVLDNAYASVGLLHVDLDRFKWVNDTLGHPAGDTVLSEAARRISIVVSDKGAVYRVGGDEFLIIMQDGVTSDLAQWVGDAIVEAMAAPICHGNQRATVGASVGFAIAKNGCVSPSRLLANADVALYAAKRGGRNMVCETTSEMEAQIRADRRLAADIPAAIERQEFVAYFQPQVNVGTGAVVGAEALVRWQHPELGLLLPGTFLDSAAELGLLAEIDRHMLRQALDTAARLKQQGLILPSVSVNISAARLVDPELPKEIDEIWVDRSCRLAVELLETIYFDESRETPQFEENLTQLREMGVRIETDDFGSGRASITGLLKIWPDRLKVDRSLIQAAVTEPVKRSIVSAILDMTRGLGIEAMAEGVETQNDIDVIRALGCNIFQGYALSRPLNEADLATFLDTQQSTWRAAGL
ncbi:EAL domain-containing protein [Cognatiyoonia sp. IB215446]|uniref:sensor domain-containing protein n=1 Tax=Cognatiyoonia sp. IB215446 TaxID=3097355 RepID=UPI002A1565C7|nr:EAL domain-containing protein [Cognatiyoonia sp. IB215446]MDX8350596.1 EAL domain-containing protein [Cognatiyoonia sp. IB215446]